MMGKKRRRHTAPADGERAAIGGYLAQYRLSADVILQCLRHETLEWIRLADPKAGRVDDFQIETPGRVDGYQVKWSRDGGTFTFRDLTAPDGDKPCLIAQLADGWKTLLQRSPSRRAVVHLRTNETASVTKLLDRDGVGGKGSFSEFLKQVWYPAHESGSTISAEWQPAWNALVQASSLNAVEFAQFVGDCELEFGVHLPGEFSENSSPDPGFDRDLRQMTEFLLSFVADPANVVDLSRSTLLDRIGWTSRLTYVSRHEFPDPTIPYREITTTADRLRVTLQNVHRGYVALLGDPGSGKSTLLTKTLLALPHRIIRYYAFVPDASDPRALRGEAACFLHDVALALDRAGFRTGRSISDVKDADQLVQRLHEQLGLLHEDWRATGCKTVILIDGLDHIPRELKPQNSLLRYLPSPNQIPDGVVIVLGSQTDQLEDLPHSVHHTIQNSERRIEIERLSRELVIEILENAKLAVTLTDKQLREVERLVAGHPLALALLVNRLSDLADDETVDEIISSTAPFGEQIDEIYHSHWRQVVDNPHDEELAALLAKLVRLRPAIDLNWVESWAGTAVIGRLRRHLHHLFRREGRQRWHIFHNSFRQFLLHRTADAPPDGFDEDRDRRIHAEIADLCGAESPSSRWSWEEAYHRHYAGQHRQAVELANAERLRSQLFAYRPIDSIEGDIRRAISSAGILRDFVALARLMLVGAEFQSRGQAISDISLPELLLRIGDIEKACHFARDGRQLRMSAEAALDFSLELEARGFLEEARLLFELAEPIGLLKTPKAEHELQPEQVTLLRNWAIAAVSFRPIADVVKLIRGTRQHGTTWNRDTDASKEILALQNSMLFQAGDALIDMKKWDDFELLFGELESSDSPGTDEQFWLCVHAWEACYGAEDLPRAQDFVERAVGLMSLNRLGDEGKVRLAEGILRVIGDAERAKGVFEEASPPALTTDIGTVSHLEPFMQRFRFTRLLYVFGEKKGPGDLIPDALNRDNQPAVFLERGLCEIARVWALSWRRISLNGPPFVVETRSLLWLFCRNWNDDARLRWELLTRHRPRFYQLLVRAAEQHGPGAVQQLGAAFEEEWFESDRSRYWPLDVIRSTTRALYAAGAEREWCRNVLERTESRSSDKSDTSGRLAWREDQANSWIDIGEPERARPLLSQILQLAAGIGYRKDHQLDSWVEWMRMANEIQPHLAGERIRFVTSAAIGMVQSTEGNAATSAAALLLKSTFDWNPCRAVTLCRVLSENGVIEYASAAAIVVSKALESDNPPTETCLSYCVHLLIPISTSSYGPLARDLVRRFGEDHGDEAAKRAAHSLLRAVDVHAISETRSGWRRGIAEGLEELQIPLDEFDIDLENAERSENDSPHTLDLTDGRQLSRRQISAEVHTTNDLLSLVEAEIGSSYFDWTPHVRELAQRLSADEVVALAEQLQLRRREANVIAALADRLCELGDLERAWTLGLRAVDCASDSGWDRYYDGGTTQSVFKVLVRIDPERGRALAFDSLVEYLSGEWWYPLNSAMNLDRIAPLVCEPVPTLELWSVIEQYLQALFFEIPLVDASILELDENQVDSTPRALANLTCEFLGHPGHLLSQGAVGACVDLLLAKNMQIQNVLCEMLGHVDMRTLDALIAVDAVSKRNVAVIQVFSNQIQNLRLSPDQSIRWAAERIAHRLNLPTLEVRQSPSVLADYRGRAIVSATERLYGSPKESPFDIVPDSYDPRDLVSPFLDDVKVIAEAAAIPYDAVLCRVVEFMREISPESSWNAEAEEQLRWRMDQAELKFPFRRPRASHARRAVFHVLAELADGGRISSEELAKCETMFRMYDVDLVLRQPVVRPRNILPVTCPQYNEFRAEWVQAVNDEELRPLCAVYDRRVVLAEYSELKPGGQGMPREFRRSVIVPEEMLCPNSRMDDSQFFPFVIRQHVADYHSGSVELEEFSAVTHLAYGYETPGERWLALNPTLGRSLGWEPSENRLLGWEQTSQLMAETVWWSDGSLQHSMPFYRKDEVGEGWLVVITKEATDQLVRRFGRLKRVCAVTREIFEDRRRVSRTRYFDMAFVERG